MLAWRKQPRSPEVGIIMGSRSDWETMSPARETLAELGIPCEMRVVSAHRMPDEMFEYAESAAHARGIRRDHRGCRRRRAPARHDRREDARAGDRRAGTSRVTQRCRFAALDRRRCRRAFPSRRWRSTAPSTPRSLRLESLRCATPASRSASLRTSRGCTTGRLQARRLKRRNDRRHRRRPARPHVRARREAHGVSRRHARSARTLAVPVKLPTNRSLRRTTTSTRSNELGTAERRRSRTSSKTSTIESVRHLEANAISRNAVERRAANHARSPARESASFATAGLRRRSSPVKIARPDLERAAEQRRFSGRI